MAECYIRQRSVRYKENSQPGCTRGVFGDTEQARPTFMIAAGRVKILVFKIFPSKSYSHTLHIDFEK